MNSLKKGDRVIVSGDSSELWIEDYNVRVSTEATVEQTPDKYSKKVLLTLDTIDGENDVVCYVRKSHIRPCIMYAIRIYKEEYSFENYDDNIYRCKEADVNIRDVKIYEPYCSAERLIKGWHGLLTTWEGWTYCVKDLINDVVITGGVYDPSDIEYVEAYIKEVL